MVLHPGMVGWCNRLQLLEDFFTHVREHPDVWNATASSCAQWWKSSYPASEYLKLEPAIWRDHPGSLS
jgi:hypothetical protein